ncbi:MAG: hypothetical protein ACK5JJ_07325 [Cyanobacteriota bacterium]
MLVSQLRTAAIVPALSQALDVFDGGLGNALWDLAGKPALDIDFAGTQSLIDRVSGQNLTTFTRSTTKVHIGPSGTFETAAINTCPLIYDPATLRCLGVQPEPGTRVNLLLNTDTLSGQSLSVTAQAYTLSFYGTGTVTLSGAATATVNGTGAFPTRTIQSFTPTAGTLTLTVTGSVRFAQLEARANVTTYVPSTSSQGISGAENLFIGGANFSNIYNPATPTTIYIEAIPVTALVNGPFASLNDGTTTNRATIRNTGGTSFSSLVQTSSITDAGPSISGALTNGIPFKGALVIRNGGTFCNIFANGASGTADTSFNIPAYSRLAIGGETGSGGGHIISRIVVWNKELTASITA